MFIGAVTIWFLFAVLTAVVASSKGRMGFGWFLLGLLFGIFALIIVAVLPNLTKRELRKVHKEVKGLGREVAGTQHPQIASTTALSPKIPFQETETKQCPECAEMVKGEARICRFCGYEFLTIQEADLLAQKLDSPRVRGLAETIDVTPMRALELIEFALGCDDHRRLNLVQDYFARAEKLWPTNRQGALEMMEIAYVLAEGNPSWKQKIMGYLAWYKKHVSQV